MHLSKKQLIILGAIAVLFLGFLIFLGSCNKRLAVPERPQQAEVQPAQEKTPAQDDPPSIPDPIVTTRSISTAMGDISVTESTSYDETLTWSRREYLSFDKSRIQACRVEGETRQAALFIFQYQPIDATIHYFDTDSNAWVSEPLSPGAYRDIFRSHQTGGFDHAP